MASTRDVYDVLERVFADDSDLDEDSDSDFDGEDVQSYLPRASPDFFDQGEAAGDGSEEMELGSGGSHDISNGKAS